MLGQHVHFHEGSGVEQMINPLPGGQLPQTVLFFHILLSPSGSDRFFDLPELLNFIPYPTHVAFLQAGEGRIFLKS
jgi:hypothetical protein